MQRKLTAILSADVVGYSGLMEADETRTLERLKVNRALIFDPAVTAHGGRIFKLMGDGTLAEFPSVVAAMECALAIQDATEKAESSLPEAKRIRYRIGVNLGEVVVDGDDIYGEGVNVAARLQTLAPIAGVALSRIVRDQVDGKVECAFDDMGEHQVKAHERPVHAFSVRAAAAAGGGASLRASPAQHKMAICVLPFANMSGDAEQEYFSDGISEDIITDLSKVSALSVVARNTAFQFKGRNVDVAQVARQLKVGHVLEGSVRKSGGRVRITAQLIDATTGGHIWAERYDRDLNDIFALQDEISQAIVNALKLKLLPEEREAIEQRGTNSVDAYNLYLMARQEQLMSAEGDARRNEAIIRLCQRAVEIDPKYAQAWSLMALGQAAARYSHGGGGDGGISAAQQALALDPNLGEAHATKARILSEEGDDEGASGEIEIALQLDPESYEVNSAAARIRFRQRKVEAAIEHWEKAVALTDLDPSSMAMLVTCYMATGNRPAAVDAAERSFQRCQRILAQDRNNGSAMAFGADALALLGQTERAKQWIDRALLVDPDNLSMRYIFACALVVHLGDIEGAIAMLEPVFAKTGRGRLMHAMIDPDLDLLREDPRFKSMLAKADARLAVQAKK